MITKEKIIFHLRNFSNEKKPLSARYFYDQLGDEGESLRDFQRKLASIISEIIIDQMTYKNIAICSCNDGYFIPKTEEGYLRGIYYLHSKIDEVQQRIRFLDEMRRSSVNKELASQPDIFSVDTNG